MNEWISVKDRLPNKAETVAVWASGELNVMTYAGNNEWWDFEGWNTAEFFGISHWMRISEPLEEINEMRFKQFEIRKPTFLGNPPTEDYYKYNFDIVKWADNNSYCWSIGHLEWNKKEPCFEFKSVGLRYLEHREDGLEEWLLNWCELKELEYKNEDDN